jgi:hypothetical protein
MADCTVFNDASLVYIAGLGEAGTPGTAFVSKPESGAHLSVTRDGNAWGRVNRLGQYEAVAGGMPQNDFDIVTKEFLGNYARELLTNRWRDSEPATTPSGSSVALANPTVNTWNIGLTGMVEIVNVAPASSFFSDSLAINAAGFFTIACIIRMENGAEPVVNVANNSSVDVNISLGSVNINDENLKIKQNLGNGLWFVCGSANCPAASGNTWLRKRDLQSTNKAYISAVMVVAGDVLLTPYDYIKTTGATLTRNPDIITRTGISSLIGQTQGRIKLNANIRTFAADATIAEFWEDADNFIRISKLADNTINLLIHSAGVERINISSTTITAGIFNIEVGYRVGVCELIINGGTAITATATSIPACSKYNLGSKQDNTAYLNGHVKTTSMQQNF